MEEDVNPSFITHLGGSHNYLTVKYGIEMANFNLENRSQYFCSKTQTNMFVKKYVRYLS